MSSFLDITPFRGHGASPRSRNIDDELGLVEPFIEEKGYRFPVLPAYSFIHNMLDSVGVPQNWILDRGKWQWNMLGFNSAEADWEGATLAKLEEVAKASR